jgi:hypothetical protein
MSSPNPMVVTGNLFNRCDAHLSERRRIDAPDLAKNPELAAIPQFMAIQTRLRVRRLPPRRGPVSGVPLGGGVLGLIAPQAAT